MQRPQDPGTVWEASSSRLTQRILWRTEAKAAFENSGLLKPLKGMAGRHLCLLCEAALTLTWVIRTVVAGFSSFGEQNALPQHGSMLPYETKVTVQPQ